MIYKRTLWYHGVCFLGGCVDNYYQSLKQHIDKLLAEGNQEEVRRVVLEELSMPYVPADTLEWLKEIEISVALPKPSHHHELDELFDAGQYEACLYRLLSYHLAEQADLVQDLLSCDLADELKGELIEALIEQGIETNFVVNKEGLSMTFCPASLLKREQDPVYQATQSLFETWFFQNPTYLRFCSRLLQQERLERLPLDFEGQSPEGLAASIAQLVAESFGQTSDFLKDVADKVPLWIERRGDMS